MHYESAHTRTDQRKKQMSAEESVEYEITYRSDMTVEYVDHMGNDLSIIRAMMVSTKGGEAWTDPITGGHEGRINFLMKNRHGTPFEHNAFTLYVEAPIFVFREFHRHRIGFSYNEMSGRYRELPPTFYVPDAERPLTQVGKPGAYEFIPGTDLQLQDTQYFLKQSYETAYDAYQRMLQQGIAKEVARACLPVATYSAMFVTCNARSLMSFLSLRTKSALSTFPSYPQREIEMVAEKMEDIFATHFPLTHAAFDANGRVAP